MTDRPSVLVLDLAGVVARWHPERRGTALAALAGLTEREVEARVFESGFDDECEQGRYDLAGNVASLTDILDIDPGPTVHAALREAWALCITPDPEMLLLARSVQAPTVLFTNNGPLLQDATTMDHAEIAEAFDTIVFSWQLGAHKPQRAAYEAVAKRLGAGPGDIFFADDSEKNVDGARRAGWIAHRFTAIDALRAELIDHALLPDPSAEGNRL